MDTYSFIFAVLAVTVCLCLYSVLTAVSGQCLRPTPVMIASVLCAVNYVAYEAKWYAAIEARLTPISGPARLVDGDAVAFVGKLLAMALCMGATLVLSFLHWKDWKTKKPGQDGGPVYLKRAKHLGGLLRDRPSPLDKLRNRFRRRLTPGEIQRREQNSRTRL